jgi:type IV pilus assembly protein PilW
LTTETNGATFQAGYAGQTTGGSLILLKNNTAPIVCRVYAVSGVAVAGNTTTITYNGTFKGRAWTSEGKYDEGSQAMPLSDLRLVTLGINTSNTKPNTLEETEAVAATTAALADNIVAFKVYYGLDDGSYQKATGAWSAASLNTNAANVLRIRSVRVFLVARSPVLVKPNAAGVCDATSDVNPMPSSWVGGPTVDTSLLSADWQCYRYKATNFVIPLRNKTI